MDFSPNGSPEEMMKAVQRLLRAFNDAAANTTGAAKQKFTFVNESFTNLLQMQAMMASNHPEMMDAVQSGDISAIIKAQQEMMQDPQFAQFQRLQGEFQTTMMELEEMAMTDASVAKNLDIIAMEMMSMGQAAGLTPAQLEEIGKAAEKLADGTGLPKNDALPPPMPRPKKRRNPAPGNDGPVSL